MQFIFLSSFHVCFYILSPFHVFFYVRFNAFVQVLFRFPLNFLLITDYFTLLLLFFTKKIKLFFFFFNFCYSLSSNVHFLFFLIYLIFMPCKFSFYLLSKSLAFFHISFQKYKLPLVNNMNMMLFVSMQARIKFNSLKY